MAFGLPHDEMRSSHSSWLPKARATSSTVRYQGGTSRRSRRTDFASSGLTTSARAQPEAIPIPAVFQQAKQRQSAQSGEIDVAGLYGLKDGVAGVSEDILIESQIRDLDAQPPAIHWTEIGAHSWRKADVELAQYRLANDESTRIPRIGKRFDFVRRPVGSHQN
jgi:hypothetical protein